MKRLLIYPIGLALLAVLSWSATAHGADYSFSLDGPNTSGDPANGDVLRTTGAGSFDTDGSVNAHGRFTISDSDGAVTSRGRWSATAFVTFQSYGGPSPGFQAGILDITVTFFPNKGGDAVTGLEMKVVCNIPEGPTTPLGGFQTGVDQGTTVGEFDVTDVATSFTLFNLHQNP